MAEGRNLTKRDITILRNIAKKMRSITIDWVKIYHKERQQAVDRVEELEDDAKT